MNLKVLIKNHGSKAIRVRVWKLCWDCGCMAVEVRVRFRELGLGLGVRDLGLGLRCGSRVRVGD